jgi:tetratricopeptide (TPR) repeat protein
LLEENPRDVKVLHELGRLYHDVGDHENEVEIYNQVTAINPLDAQSLRLGKDASARASMKRGGWTQAESYRDLIKDKDEAISLEQQSRIRLTGEALEQQIAETYARHQAEPENLDFARRLGALSEQKEDLESAIRWYQYAVDLAKGADTGVLRKISDLKMKCLEHEIAEIEEFLSTCSARDKVYAEKSGQLQTAKISRAEILIADAQERVKRNPTDLQLRFELGDNFFKCRAFSGGCAGTAARATKSACPFESNERVGLLLWRAWHARFGDEATGGSLKGNLVHGRDEEGNRLQSRHDL